ncbi:hypothetical protein [Hyphomicrobium sp.]|uniref:hypothetical protein n=1 Tax=Hyphomicrobium sp. TaxID=82 RepID=UPI002D0532E4|nr:hypothetical protein [Hyphomicrobium sp.]HRN89902.1 hypothetical protein [Hyphomicrobium sp.]HRQ27166.1 hypothetical protein [Hyphomicrobium sp.]
MVTELGTGEWMMIWGGGIMLFAAFVLWRVSRYDLVGAAWDSAWHVARGQRSAESPTALEEKYRDIAGQASVTGKARRAAGTVIGHFIAKVLSVVATIALIVGLALIGLGWHWL